MCGAVRAVCAVWYRVKVLSRWRGGVRCVMCWRELGAQEVLDSHVQGARHHETVSKKRACFTVNNFLPRGAGGEAAAVFPTPRFVTGERDKNLILLLGKRATHPCSGDRARRTTGADMQAQSTNGHRVAPSQFTPRP